MSLYMLMYIRTPRNIDTKVIFIIPAILQSKVTYIRPLSSLFSLLFATDSTRVWLFRSRTRDDEWPDELVEVLEYCWGDCFFLFWIRLYRWTLSTSTKDFLRAIKQSSSIMAERITTNGSPTILKKIGATTANRWSLELKFCKWNQEQYGDRKAAYLKSRQGWWNPWVKTRLVWNIRRDDRDEKNS